MLSRLAIGGLRMLPRTLAWKLARHVPAEQDVLIDGIVIRCSIKDNVTERELAFGRQPQDDELVRGIIDAVGPGDTFVDIGANCGLFSLLAATRVGASGKVIAVEPIPLMADRLRHNAAANGFANIDLVQAALGSEAGTATLHIRRRNYGQSSMHPLAGFEPISVPTMPLMDVLASRNVEKIAALKIDVEGFEDRILIPFFDAAPRGLWPKRILMETVWSDRWERDCLPILEKCGYRRILGDENEALFELQ